MNKESHIWFLHSIIFSALVATQWLSSTSTSCHFYLFFDDTLQSVAVKFVSFDWNVFLAASFKKWFFMEYPQGLIHLPYSVLTGGARGIYTS